MKELKSKTMKRFLARGLRAAKKTKRPQEGCMKSLIYETLPNGYHYQVEYAYDHRNSKSPETVVVYCFRPPKDQSAAADYYLERETKN